MNTHLIRTVVGIIGNVISFFLFLSPVPTFVKIWKNKSVQSYKSDPYIATILNCVMWVWYGMPFNHPNSTLVVTINGIGFFIELFYIIVFFVYSDRRKRRRIVISLLVEIVFMGVVILLTLLACHGTKVRTIFIGALCVFFNVIMYTAPLTIMKRVIVTKSVKFMPFYLSLANFVNGIVWAIYALLPFDPWVFIPNGLGSISGLVQLVLYGVYYRTTDWDDDDKRNEVELQNPTAQNQV